MLVPTKDTPIQDGPEQIIIQTIGNITLTSKGVVSTEALQIMQFRAMKDGTNPRETVDRKVVSLVNPPDKFKAVVETFLAAREELYQKFLQDIGE